ncbi:hypothetical protein [Methylibium petroleiphilum]|uniref:Uncharacterized protein n=1 Tax=Methylibium petroleiphilum (strain ATCC BAA-1232 / LMG 22953 / PM1) TaxID=420662 RepID=A2SNI0_METPP|nr:hypothetical protein [Methylibium petroleiphilum]ABM97119.1 hypothetical protein Mpe_B0344 [Methylibium petroleiphilum PM1]
MKTIIYTYEEGRVPSDGSGRKRTVKLWFVRRNKPVEIGEYKAAFIGEYQLVMEALKHFKALPAKAFERRGPSNTLAYQSAEKLREAGIADLIRL